MKTSTLKRNILLALLAICLIGSAIAVAFGAGNFSPLITYAMESKEMDDDNFMGEKSEFKNITMLSGGGGRSDNIGIISGTDPATLRTQGDGGVVLNG